MEEVKQKTTAVADKDVEEKKTRNPTNTVMLVQTVVCILAVLFIVAMGKLSPETFAYIKEEYERIMSVDMDSDDISESVKSFVGTASAKGAEPRKKDEQASAKSNPIRSASNGETVAVMSMFGSNEDITVPVHGEITSEYGNRTNPVTEEYIMHSGIDIAASAGTEIRAAYNGVVSEVGSNSVGGNYISIVHTDGSETLYCHCQKILAQKGDVVRAGESVALVGSTGRSTGPHLHFEISVDGETIDPLIYLPVKNGAV